jgi:hypothetical protein
MAVADQPFAQDPDNRDAAADARLEPYRASVTLRRAKNFRAMLGEHRLVPGYHVFARGERPEDQAPRRLDAAEKFDDDIDVVAHDECGGVARD